MALVRGAVPREVAERSGLVYGQHVARLVSFLLFMRFMNDEGCFYNGRQPAPMAWFNWFEEPTIIEVRPIELILLTILLIASLRGPKSAALVRPMKNALLMVLVTTVVWFVFGLSRGGQFRFACWQTYPILSFVLVSFTIAATFHKSSDFYALGKWLIAAATYRAMMCWIAYFTWGRSLVGESGAFLTSHDDTIPWVVSVVILVLDAIEHKSALIKLRNSALILFLLGAIQWNSRRLAWVSLAMGLVAMYVLLPRGAVKRRLNRLLLVGAPLLLLYVAIGWGRANPIFLPLRSLSTVTTQEDGSTLARNAENLGLIATANYSNAALGTGWGKPYVYLTLKYDISSFELWRYVPHNSILGLLAFTGFLGFAGFWLPFPAAIFLNARIARLAHDPRARRVAIIGAAQMLVAANQLYGDMGLFFLRPMIALAVSYAIAMRLPPIAGVWDAVSPKVSTLGRAHAPARG
jgi:hypothetical protein